MFARQEKRRLQQQNRKRNPFYEEYEGINRRAVALFPGETFAESASHLTLTNKTTVRQQLLNIEAQHTTCCVKIDSPKFKSRAALLLVKGRVLACVYGSTKIPQQVFGKGAYEQLMAEITHNGNIFDSYVLSDNMVLAAGSMFHGEVFNATKGRSAASALKYVVQQFEACETPGAIALVDSSDRPVCLVYFANHEVIGIYSFLEEINMHDMASLVEYLKINPGTQVLASMLNLSAYNLPNDLTFSLSGLNEAEPVKQLDRVTKTQLEAANLVLLNTLKPLEREVVRTDRFISSTGRNTAPRLNHLIQIKNPYRIDPSRTY
jgi:hypothetical protein